MIFLCLEGKDTITIVDNKPIETTKEMNNYSYSDNNIL